MTTFGSGLIQLFVCLLLPRLGCTVCLQLPSCRTMNASWTCRPLIARRCWVMLRRGNIRKEPIWPTWASISRPGEGRRTNRSIRYNTGHHRVIITPRGPKHIRLFLAQNLLSWWGKCAWEIQIKGVVHFYICYNCVYRIFKRRGSSVQCSKYSLKFQWLNNLNLFKNSVRANMNFCHPSSLYLSRALVPPWYKSFVLRKDEYALSL